MGGSSPVCCEIIQALPTFVSLSHIGPKPDQKHRASYFHPVLEPIAAPLLTPLHSFSRADPPILKNQTQRWIHLQGPWSLQCIPTAYSMNLPRRSFGRTLQSPVWIRFDLEQIWMEPSVLHLHIRKWRELRAALQNRRRSSSSGDAHWPGLTTYRSD